MSDYQQNLKDWSFKLDRKVQGTSKKKKANEEVKELEEIKEEVNNIY